MTVQDEIRAHIEQDAELARLRARFETGKATYADTSAYSSRAGKLLGEILSRRLPDIPPEEREALCVELLHDRYIDINKAVDTVQQYMDEAQGLHLAPQRAPYNEERSHQIGSSLRDVTKPIETLQRRARAAAETATKAVHDDRMEAEAKFRDRAGLRCYITRETVGQTCAWCRDVAGRYVYGREPRDVFGRHDNCDCTVIFQSGRQRQDVWSKRTWERPAPDAGAEEPTVFSREDAEAVLESRQAGLTSAGERGIITGRGSGTGSASDSAHYYELIGKLDPDDKRAIDASLSEFEHKYKDSTLEHCIVITTTGEVYEVHGDRYTVNTSLLGDRMRGSTNEHNHVTGESQYSFSWEDLREAAADGSKVVLAYDEKYRYHMVFPDVRLDSDTVYEAYDRAKESVGNDLIFKPETIQEGDEQHERIRRACEELGIEYSRNELSR